MKVSGIDANGGPYDPFKTVKIDGKATKVHTLTEKQITTPETTFEIEMAFQGHYGETDLTI